MIKRIVSMCMILCAFAVHGQAREYVVGVENMDYMPYYSGETDSYTGFVREVLDAFAQINGMSFTYKPLPVNRLFKSLLANHIDFKFPDNPSWQAELKKGKTLSYSNAIVSTIDGVMVVPQNKGKGISSLKSLGTVMGFSPWVFQDKIDSGAVVLSENSNFDGLLKQVILLRIDGAYTNPVVAEYRLETSLHKPGALVFDDGLPHVKSDYRLSTLNHKEVIDALNVFLEEKKELVRQLKDKYGIRDME